MVVYPLETLMSCGVRDVMFITRPVDLPLFERLLGDGSKLGMSIAYGVQREPNGIAASFLIARDFLRESSHQALILGDNFFHGPHLASYLNCQEDFRGAKILGYQVINPSDYGVIEFDEFGNVTSLEEKPAVPRSSWVVPGLYLYDSAVLDIVGSLTPSARGELEITDVNRAYLAMGALAASRLPRGSAWLDMGTPETLLAAGKYVQAIQDRQGIRLGCVEETAWRQGWISDEDLEQRANDFRGSDYGAYLLSLISS